MAFLEENTKAPDFCLKDQEGREVRLSDFRGKKVVLYFYPRDNTPGCTREACAFARLKGEFDKYNTVILGLSKDNEQSHMRFALKHELPFTLLSDPEHQVLELYGAWQEKKLYGKVSMGTVRSTYLIDEEGTIIKIFKRAKADTNAQECLDIVSGVKPAAKARAKAKSTEAPAAQTENA